jgi:RimJ/RimL family protein N-acetyltransferase
MNDNLFTKFFPADFTLETPRVLLRSMTENDYEAFLPLCVNKDTWQYFSKDLSDPQELRAWVDTALKEKAAQQRMPFTIYDKDAKQICGSSSYGNISFYDKRLEIGWSWLGPDFIGTGVNKQAKFALLSYAFEVMRMERVEIKTDVLNERSKAALLKVGMKPEGVLRSHSLMHSNRRRDSIYFSILKDEWVERKQSFFVELL